MIKKTSYYSYSIGKLTKGCTQCIKGEKSVFFVTGVCSKKCFFCPISDQKKDQDVTYINEHPTIKEDEIIAEIKACKSKGAGITGGDPLSRIARTVQYIKKFKEEFGPKFHVHLYTPLDLVTKTTLTKLYRAGLDEIRFHPDLVDNTLWPKLKLAKEFDWNVGIEIPVIPENKKEIINLIEFSKDYIDFLNMNELEVSDTNANQLVEKGYTTKDDISYGIKNSTNIAKQILKYIDTKKIKLNVHFCTCKLKDKVQLTNRILKRAKSVKTKFDIITEDGTLVRPVIFYSKEEDIKTIVKLIQLKKSDYIVDKKGNRLLVNPDFLEEYAHMLNEHNFKPAILEEYPTFDRFLVDVTYL